MNDYEELNEKVTKGKIVYCVDYDEDYEYIITRYRVLGKADLSYMYGYGKVSHYYFELADIDDDFEEYGYSHRYAYAEEFVGEYARYFLDYDSAVNALIGRLEHEKQEIDDKIKEWQERLDGTYGEQQQNE